MGYGGNWIGRVVEMLLNNWRCTHTRNKSLSCSYLRSMWRHQREPNIPYNLSPYATHSSMLRIRYRALRMHKLLAPELLSNWTYSYYGLWKDTCPYRRQLDAGLSHQRLWFCPSSLWYGGRFFTEFFCFPSHCVWEAQRHICSFGRALCRM